MGRLGRCAVGYGAIALGIGACAAGADAEGDNFGPPPSTVSVSQGDGTGEGSSTGDDKEETGGESEPAMDGSTDDGLADDTAAASTGEGGSTGDEGGSTGDDGSGMACDNELTCAAADPIGGVAGDESTPQIVVTGDTPTWVTFQVSENNSDFTGETLSFRVTLASPATADFDLYVFRGPEGGSSGCGGTTMQSTNAAGTDMVQMEWGEGALANNVDDGVWVAVEVRAKNGTCDPPAQWTLTVAGDT